jgi:hypothetical protein
LKPAQANSLQDPFSKINRAKCNGDMAQAVKHLLCKHKALSSNPSLRLEVEHLPYKCKALSSNLSTAKKKKKDKNTV